MGACLSKSWEVMFIDNSRNFDRRQDMYIIRCFNEAGYPIYESQTRVGCFDQIKVPVQNVTKIVLYYLPEYDAEIEIAAFELPGSDVLVVPFF